MSATRNSGASAVSTSCPAPGEFVLVLRGDHLAHARLEALLNVDQALVRFGGLLLRLLGGQDSRVDERPGVALADRRQVLDAFVHDRLRVGRFIAFVVAVTPIPDQVDEDVLVELVAIGHRQTNGG